MSAPVVAITAYDEKFYDHLPFLMPHRDVRSYFSGDPAFAARSAFQNGTLQVAYLIIALARRRSRHRTDDRLRQCEGRRGVLPRGNVKSNVLINIGYGDHEKLFPRSPRFSFDRRSQKFSDSSRFRQRLEDA